MAFRAIGEHFLGLRPGKLCVPCLHWLVWVPAAALLLPNLRGRGGITVWTLLSLLPPFLVFLAMPAYRQRLRVAIQRCRSALADYPAGTGPTPWRALFLCVVLPAAVFFMIGEHGISSGDSRPAALTACSLVAEGNWELGEFVDGYVERRLFVETPGQPPYFFRSTPHGVYSAYPSGMVVFALPAAMLARASGADLKEPKVHHHIERWTAAWVAAACLGLFFLIGLHVAAPAPVGIVTVLLAVGSVMFSTVAQALWQHGGVILGMLTILLVEFRCSSRPFRGGPIVQGIAAALMVACGLPRPCYWCHSASGSSCVPRGGRFPWSSGPRSPVSPGPGSTALSTGRFSALPWTRRLRKTGSPWGTATGRTFCSVRPEEYSSTSPGYCWVLPRCFPSRVARRLARIGCRVPLAGESSALVRSCSTLPW